MPTPTQQELYDALTEPLQQWVAQTFPSDTSALSRDERIARAAVGVYCKRAYLDFEPSDDDEGMELVNQAARLKQELQAVPGALTKYQQHLEGLYAAADHVVQGFSGRLSPEEAKEAIAHCIDPLARDIVTRELRPERDAVLRAIQFDDNTIEGELAKAKHNPTVVAAPNPSYTETIAQGRNAQANGGGRSRGRDDGRDSGPGGLESRLKTILRNGPASN